MSKIIITGASGTVARPIIEVLQDKHELILFDRVTGFRSQIHKLDITNFKAVVKKIPPADILIHLAAIPLEDKPEVILKIIS
ncbi:MAG: NAD-dependent epimerase/dehydratase family protein [Hydrococcus sp. SU_1_0]|nr:NAD-dependent epimerase/dehydratase family protein [Hydrococcus sp. SU_1_0]